MEAAWAAAGQPAAFTPPPGALRAPLQLGDIVLHHLRTEAEIAEIVFLRDEIDLSVHTAGGRQSFEALEKKETSAGSSSGSSWAANGSGPSASCRWACS